MNAPAVPDLAARILAAIERVEQRENRPCSPGAPSAAPCPRCGERTTSPWLNGPAIYAMEPCRCWLTFEQWAAVTNAEPRPAHDVLRRCAADRRLAERHQRGVEANVYFDDGNYRDVEYCVVCTLGQGCDHCISWTGDAGVRGPAVRWPCDTITDLAEVYDVPIEVAEEGQPA